jgi:hypothetical protein
MAHGRTRLHLFRTNVTCFAHLSPIPLSLETTTKGKNMAPKPGPKRLAFKFGMALAMAVTIVAITTWTSRNWATPGSSPIYHPQLLLLY